MCGHEGNIFRLRPHDLNPWKFQSMGQIIRLRTLDKNPWKCYTIMSKWFNIHIECRQMCREYGKIDQNSSWNLLTNMDRYAANFGYWHYVKYMGCSITYVSLYRYNYSIWYAIYFINSPLCSTLLHYISLRRAIREEINGRGM